MFVLSPTNDSVLMSDILRQSLELRLVVTGGFPKALPALRKQSITD